MDRTEELLEEPLYIGGTCIRRWDEFARLPRPDAAAPGALRRPRGSWRSARGDVPMPRSAQTVERAAEPAAE